jgi:hypothetical protein
MTPTNNVGAELEARTQEIRALEAENARWKTRTQEILAKYDVRIRNAVI